MDSPNSCENIRGALSPCNSIRRNNSHSDSTEFEFWMVRNPNFPQPNLLSADELFVDGVLLPLYLLSNKPSDPPDLNPYPGPKPSKRIPGEEEEAEPEADAGTELRHVSADLKNGLTSSKRWKNIFNKGGNNSLAKNVGDKEKEKRREKKSQCGASSAELNINIWPFSRSRSAGNNGSRPRMVSGALGTPKVSSAPCSRSNSGGESKSRQWPSSPGRSGVHLGRSSPVWQVKRGGGRSGLAKSSEASVRNGEKMGTKKETRGKLAGNGSSNNNNKDLGLNLNVNVPAYTGYRHHLSCTSSETRAIGGGGSVRISKSGSNCGGGRNGNGGGNNSGNNLFNFRSLFIRKVY